MYSLLCPILRLSFPSESNQLFSSEMSSEKLRSFPSSLRPSTTCLNNNTLTHFGHPSSSKLPSFHILTSHHRQSFYSLHWSSSGIIAKVNHIARSPRGQRISTFSQLEHHSKWHREKICRSSRNSARTRRFRASQAFQLLRLTPKPTQGGRDCPVSFAAADISSIFTERPSTGELLTNKILAFFSYAFSSTYLFMYCSICNRVLSSIMLRSFCIVGFQRPRVPSKVSCLAMQLTLQQRDSLPSPTKT